MSAVAAAVVGSSLIGAYTSKNAADKQASASKAGMAQANALAGQSRANAVNLYNQGLKARQAGDQAAFKFYQDNAKSRYAPMISGNMAAQKAIGLGAQQANNAILGLPTDLSYMQPQQVYSGGLSSAELPQSTSDFKLQDEQPQQSGGVSASNINDSVKKALLNGAIGTVLPGAGSVAGGSASILGGLGGLSAGRILGRIF